MPLLFNKENKWLYLIVLGGFILRIIALPFAQVVDADATTRIFIAENWLDNPHLISDGVWPPLHFYFNAIAIAIFGEHITGPILFHIILACATAIPLYHFTKREFSDKGAWFAAAFYLLCPVVFRNSFHTLSGLPHAFFIALALNYISKSIRYKDYNQAVYAGLAMTVASGFRYEAWLLIALFTGMYLLFKEWKYTIYFWCASMIFPFFWMIGNYIGHGDILYGLSGAYHWNIVMEGVNDHLEKVDLIKRIIYFPLSWFFLFSPILVGLVGWKIFKRIKHRELVRSRLIWSIPFWVVFLVFIYKAFEGTLLLQHRFTISLILLSAPFTAIIFEEVKWNNLKKTGVALLLASLIPMSYVWMKLPIEKLFKFSYSLNTAFGETRATSQDTFGAIPRLNDQDYANFSKEINKEIKENSGVILDFVSWDKTFFLALNTGLDPKQIFIVDGAKNGQVYYKELRKRLENYPEGIIMLKCYSKFSEDYSITGDLLTFHKLERPISLKIEKLGGKLGVSIFKYKIDSWAIFSECNNCLECPELNSLEYYMMVIQDNGPWMNDIKRKARENSISIEEQLKQDAQWMVDNPTE